MTVPDRAAPSAEAQVQDALERAQTARTWASCLEAVHAADAGLAALVQRVRELEDDIVLLRWTLDHHGTHDDTCPRKSAPGAGECDCGLVAVLRRTEPT